LSSLVLSLLYCRVLTVLSCLVFQRLALKSLKKSMHLRRGSLRLREMYCALFHPSCLVSRVLYTSLSSIVLHFRSIRCIRGGCSPEAFDALEAGMMIPVLYCRVLSVCSVVFSKAVRCRSIRSVVSYIKSCLAPPKHSLHPRAGSLRHRRRGSLYC
jgi:hypothetical protein